MKHCTKCKVDVNGNLTNCPLCGAYLSTDAENVSEKMQLIESRWSRPTVTIKHKQNFMKSKFYFLMVISVLFCVVLNLLTYSGIPWSAYVCIGWAFTVTCVILPVFNKEKLLNVVKHNLLIITLLAVCFELVVTRLHFGWFVVLHILPWVYVSGIVLCDFLIIFLRKKTMGTISALAFCTFFALLPQIYVWIAFGAVKNAPTYLPFVVFFASLFNLIVVCIVCTRTLKSELERNFNL